MVDPWYKTAFGPQYPLLYRHRDQAEAARCLALFLSLAPVPGSAKNLRRVLDLGCGEGRHFEVLSKNQNEVFGLDLSRPLLEMASKRQGTQEGVNLLQGDMACLPFAGGSFAAVFSLFTAFGYFGPLEKNVHVIEDISRVLVKGGFWYFDYFDCDRVTKELADRKPRTRNRVDGPLQIKEVRLLNSAGDQVRKTVSMVPLPGKEKQALAWGVGEAGLYYTEEVAVFSQNDINEQASRYQLVPQACAGSYSGVPLGQGDRWLMVFRKDVS